MYLWIYFGVCMLVAGLLIGSMAGEEANGPIALLFIPLCAGGCTLIIWALS